MDRVTVVYDPDPSNTDPIYVFADVEQAERFQAMREDYVLSEEPVLGRDFVDGVIADDARDARFDADENAAGNE